MSRSRAPVRPRAHWRASRVVVAAVGVVVIVAAVVVFVLRGGAPESTLGVTSPGTVGPTSAPATSDAFAIPVNVLLTAADVAPTFAGVSAPFAQPYEPNPFVGCGTDGLPGDAQPEAAIGVGFTGTGDSGLVGGESMLRYGPGGAEQAFTAIDRSTCSGGFRVAGEAEYSLVLVSTDGRIVAPVFAHGVALVYAVARHGDYLVWITVASQASGAAPIDVARALMQAAGDRLIDNPPTAGPRPTVSITDFPP